MTTTPEFTVGSDCLVCKHGKLRRGKRLMMTTDSFWECDYCHTEYHRRQEKFVLSQVPAQYHPWNTYEGESLTETELIRISQGGISDAQIAKEEERREQERKAEEERKRIEQTPGTPQNYLYQVKSALGIPEGESDLNLKVAWSSVAEARQHIKKLTQMQKELRQIKKNIGLTVKEIRSSYATTKVNVQASDWTYFLAGRTAARHEVLTKREDLRQQQIEALKPYQAIVALIDSTLVSIDGFKVEINKKIITNQGESSSTGSEEPKSTPRSKTKKAIAQDSSSQTESLLAELNAMIGLESVKAEVQELINFLKVQQIRKSKEMPTPPLSLHIVFYGNPGTGKTSVARLLAKIYQSLGVLSSGHLVETDRAGLVAGYVGQTALKVESVVNKALGGILFIDEAYSLTRDGAQDFGAEAN